MALALLAGSVFFPVATAQVPGGLDDDVRAVLWCVDQTTKQTLQLIENATQETDVPWAGRTVSENVLKAKCELHERGPIRIDGTVHTDEKWKYGIAEGQGTEHEPYVIRDWKISGQEAYCAYTGQPDVGPVYTGPYCVPDPSDLGQTEDYKYGIEIRNNDQHFLIEDVMLNGWKDEGGAAIRIGDGPNVYIQDTTMVSNRRGLQADGGHVYLVGSAVGASHEGVHVSEGVSGAQIRRNTIVESPREPAGDDLCDTSHWVQEGAVGICALSSDVRIEHNEVDGWDFGARTLRSDGSTEFGWNEFDDQRESSIQVWNPSGVSLHDNVATTSGEDLELGAEAVVGDGSGRASVGTDVTCSDAPCLTGVRLDGIAVETVAGYVKIDCRSPGDDSGDGDACVYLQEIDQVDLHRVIIDCNDEVDVGIEALDVGDIDRSRTQFWDCEINIDQWSWP